jgi:hypothetical protein
VVLAADTALELGPPPAASVNTILWTWAEGVVTPGRVTLRGPDLDKARPGAHDFAQIVLLGLPAREELDFFRLDGAAFLGTRLPGVMARALPGRLWLRVSRAAQAAGVDFALLAAALREACEDELGPAVSLECLFVSEGADEFLGLASEVKVLTGRHRKLALAGDGGYECVDLDCEGCAEKPVCDRIREAAEIRRRSRDGNARGA